MTTTADTPTTTEDAPPKPPLANGDHVLSAVRAVMRDVIGIAKSGEMRQEYGRDRGQVQYTFQRFEDMADAVGKSFRAHGVATQTLVTAKDYHRWDKPKQGGGSTLWTSCTVTVRYVFTSLEDGSTFTVEACGEGSDSSDKATNKAMTSALKNAYRQAFTLSTRDDGDPDAHRPEIPGEQNGQVQHQPPPEPAWQQVEQIARGQSEQNSEPSRVETAARVMQSARNAATTGDLAQLAEWAYGKGCLATDVDGAMLARRLLAARATLPVGPPTPRPQYQPTAQELNQVTDQGGH
jgi:ERF superfamily